MVSGCVCGRVVVPSCPAGAWVASRSLPDRRVRRSVLRSVPDDTGCRVRCHSQTWGAGCAARHRHPCATRFRSGMAPRSKDLASVWLSQKSVGGAVDRHRVARRLRHVARTMLVEMNPEDRIVVRALPSRTALSSRLEQQLSAGLLRAHQPHGEAPMRNVVQRARRSPGSAARSGCRCGAHFPDPAVPPHDLPLRLPTCRFMPTCSQYAVDALTEYGLVRGIGLTLVRLAKCGPWHRGGWDPFPSAAH